ncbi:MAG: Anti-sigma-K factor rskA [Acidobacteriaceae bacterium]|nr:Anti-sigma-K factor rskA [Acidobacteriaceae bacterium]
MYEAYALGALDLPERAALEAHLATRCAQCAKAVAEARWLVAQLAYLAPEASTSDMLKGRVLQTARSEAKSSSSASRTARTTPPGIPYWLSAGIAALLLLALYFAWDTHRLKEELRTSNETNRRNEQMVASAQKQSSAAQQKLAAMEEQMTKMRRENAILTDPASVKITLAAQKIQAPQMVAMWHAKYGIVLTGQKVPMPSGNRVLQLWLIPKAPGAKPMPSMTVRPDVNGNFVILVSNPPASGSDTKALAITEEPAGGSAAPTTTPKWVGAMS